MEDKRAVLKGGAFNFYDSAWKYAEEMVKQDPENLCIVPDIESGFPNVVTLEQRDKMAATFEACKPKLSIDWQVKGTLFLYGTGGSLDNKKFADVFYSGNFW